MRLYWILFAFTLFVLAAVSPDALRSLQHLLPSSAAAAMPIVLLSMAILSAFAALVLSSRNFGLVALVFGLGVTYMQQGYLRALAGYAGTAPGGGKLELSLTLSNILHGATGAMSGNMPWLLPLTLCSLLLAAVLIVGPKVE
jgi:hypothetical protein